MRKSDLVFNVIRVPVDFGMLVAAAAATYALRTRILDVFRPVLFEFNLPFIRFMLLACIVALVFMAAYAALGLYAMRGRMRLTEEFTKILLGSSAGILAIIMYIFLRQELFNSRFLVLGGWLVATVFVLLGRVLVRVGERFALTHFHFGGHRVLLIGSDTVSHTILSNMTDIRNGYRVVRHLTTPDIHEVTSVIDNPGVDDVVLADPNYDAEAIVKLVDFCHEHHISFRFVPNIYQTLTANVGVDAIAGIPVIELKRTPLDGWGRVFKRVFDIVFSASALILLSPLFGIIAFAIIRDSPGTVFVGLRRTSKNREFLLYKFRSMVTNAEELKPSLAAYNERTDGPLFKMRDDPRVTRIGRFLRRYRIDEFPQFWNVLKGDISVVGPRPHQPDEIARYQKHHRSVLAIKAGATGLAQVSGSSDLSFEDEVILDTYYVEHWSLWMDIKIVFRTVFKLFTDHSAV